MPRALLKQWKAQAAADQYNAGMQSIAGGASNLASSAIAKGGAGLGAKAAPSTDFTGQNTAALNQFNATKPTTIDSSMIPKTGIRPYQTQLLGMDEPRTRNWYSNGTM